MKLRWQRNRGAFVSSPPDRHQGFTLIEIMIVVAIIGLILSIAVPELERNRNYAGEQICIENLSQIDAAKQQWGLEMHKTTGDQPLMSDLVGSDHWLKVRPVCPAGGAYTINPIGTKPTCTVSGHVL